MSRERLTELVEQAETGVSCGDYGTEHGGKNYLSRVVGQEETDVLVDGAHD